MRRWRTRSYFSLNGCHAVPLVVRGHNSWDSTTLCVQVPLSYVGLWRLLHAVQSDPLRVHVHLEEAEEDKTVSSFPLISSGCRDNDRSLCLTCSMSVSKYALSVSLVLRRFQSMLCLSVWSYVLFYRIPSLSVSLVLRRFHRIPSLSVCLTGFMLVSQDTSSVCLTGFTSVSMHTLSVFLVLRQFQSILCPSSWFYVGFKVYFVCLHGSTSVSNDG